MEPSINTMVFDALSFMRANAKVFRKYLFLPIVFSVASLFLIKVPVAGLSLAAVSNSIAMALIGVSATRFYLLGKSEKVADGANRPFARFFFLTFVMTFMGHMSEVFMLLPDSIKGMAVVWMLFGLWLNLKICLAFPALAMDHPGTVMDNVKSSFDWTRGRAMIIIFAFLICYGPVIFFTFMLMQVPDLAPAEGDFWGGLPQLVFSNLLTIFSMLWSSLVMARLYKEVQTSTS
ncbi:hypothetical protein [Terasakiella pusilla]|uniref:hypothetical protein n=1 Tax=Terasakiella pusilla TaxID=64973 RepID=UPI003AA9A27D